MSLPPGTKVSEADVLRRFARNIRTAATTRSSHGANSGYRRAWIDAWRRIHKLEGRAP
jgi:hypothetical protein